MRARADDVAVRQETVFGHREHLQRRALFDEAVALERRGEMLRQLVVLRRRAAAEVVERKEEALAQALEDRVLLTAIFGDLEPRV